MAISKNKKELQLKKLSLQLKEAKGVGFVTFNQLSVTDTELFRCALREQGMSYKVIKKTLIAIAINDSGLAKISSKDLPGAVGIIISPDDVVLPVQTIKKFKKEFFDKKAKLAKLDFAGALFDGQFLDAQSAEEFANTPTREESLARISGALRFGVRGIHRVCNHGLQSFVRVLNDAEKFLAS